MSVPRKCDRLDPPPPPQVRPRPGTVHALVSCRGQSVTTLTRALWELLTAFEGMAVPPAGTVTVEQTLAAIGALVAREGAVNLVFDALDEAMPEQSHEIARHLLNPLSRSAGVKVVVGTRPQPRQQIAYREPDESLLQTLDRTAPSLVLDEDEETERDIADMVEAVLGAPGSPYAEPGAEAERTAAATRIAEESGRLFLIARLIAAELVRRPQRVPEDRLTQHIRAQAAPGSATASPTRSATSAPPAPCAPPNSCGPWRSFTARACPTGPPPTADSGWTWPTPCATTAPQPSPRRPCGAS